MANLRRRSARLSQAGAAQQSARKTPVSKARLDSLVERDETPEVVQPSIDGVLSTPTAGREVREQLSQLSALKTPKTEPRPERGEMHPKSIHQTTSKAPDSGLKLGFADISASTANHQNTPSKSASRQSMRSVAPANFEFKFSSDANLSVQARALMDNVREDAARIKAQMAAERAKQDQQDGEADTMFGSPRKIAQAKGRAGRFSDVHMAQFKKMDSIENHASAFRARPGFTAPTAQSLKRSPSKAGLDETERSRTAGRITPRKIVPSTTGRINSSVSSHKSALTISEQIENGSPVKRIRQSELHDVSSSRTSNLPRPGMGSLYSPTKASLARAGAEEATSPNKPSTLPRSNSVKSLRVPSSVQSSAEPAKYTSSISPVKIPQSKSMQFKSLQNLDAEPQSHFGIRRTQSVKKLSEPDKQGGFASKLPTFAGLKSILRPGRKENKSPERPATPKRPNTANTMVDSGKKVDFTPSVKSRYAVKLAATTPSPAKPRHDTPYKASEPLIPYDSAAYLIISHDDDDWEDDDEDESDDVVYPSLPSPNASSGPVIHTFTAKAKEHNRRESKEFKSIFTTLHPRQPSGPSTLTSVNTVVNKTNPTTHVDKVLRSPSYPAIRPSPSTIRRVRNSNSGSGVTELVQPFEDKIETVPHSIPGKKRRHASVLENDRRGMDEDAKENRRITAMPAIPGGWSNTVLDEEDNKERDEVEDEGERRGGKRLKAIDIGIGAEKQSPIKKPNPAREAAAKNAKERKGKGVLSLSRLNMLSRPKQRG